MKFAIYTFLNADFSEYNVLCPFILTHCKYQMHFNYMCSINKNWMFLIEFNLHHTEIAPDLIHVMPLKLLTVMLGTNKYWD